MRLDAETIARCRKSRKEYLDRLLFKLDSPQGGAVTAQICVQPSVSGPGGFFYYSEHDMRLEPKVRFKHYCRLLPAEMRRLAHALLHLADESEIQEDNEMTAELT